MWRPNTERTGGLRDTFVRRQDAGETNEGNQSSVASKTKPSAQ